MTTKYVILNAAPGPDGRTPIAAMQWLGGSTNLHRSRLLTNSYPYGEPYDARWPLWHGDWLYAFTDGTISASEQGPTAHLPGWPGAVLVEVPQRTIGHLQLNTRLNNIHAPTANLLATYDMYVGPYAHRPPEARCGIVIHGSSPPVVQRSVAGIDRWYLWVDHSVFECVIAVYDDATFAYAQRRDLETLVAHQPAQQGSAAP